MNWQLDKSHATVFSLRAEALSQGCLPLVCLWDPKFVFAPTSMFGNGALSTEDYTEPLSIYVCST